MNRAVRYIIVVLLVSVFGFASADNNCDESSSRKARKAYENALEMLRYKPKEAYAELIKVTKIDPDFAGAFYVLADINKRKSKQSNNDLDRYRYIDRAEKYISSAINVCPGFHDYEAYYFAGDIYFELHKYEKAVEFYRLYVKNAKVNSKKISKAENLVQEIEEFIKVKKAPVPFNPKSIDGVCTNNGEYLPLVSPDGEYLFYTHKYWPERSKETYINKDDYIEEFSVSKRDYKKKDAEVFESGNPLPTPFNKEGMNQGGVSVSIDNNHLYITICEQTQVNKRPYMNCDIYSTDYVNGEWTPLRNLGPNVNKHNTWESQPSISADGKTLYFSSIRESNIGFSPMNPTCDIYKTVRDENGNWSKAVNLGPQINTAGNEKSPFMHTDSQTLYFSSDGRIGFGGYDIYYSKYENNENWSKPKNIGFPINTEYDDLGFIVSTDGKKAYFASDKLAGKGGWDIYSFELYKEARPEKVLFLKGQLKDDLGEDLADAKVEIKNVKTQKVTEGMVDKITGKYAVAVTVDKEENDEFLMVVKKEGHAFTSEYIVASEEKFEEPATINFEVKPVEVGKKVQLNNIYFATASSNLKLESKVVISNFADWLKTNSTIKIAIHGHTDNEGSYKTNMKLSDDRAKAVFDYLVELGIDASRMSYKGFGPGQPIASNNTPEGRAKNRRTEFVIKGK